MEHVKNLQKEGSSQFGFGVFNKPHSRHVYLMFRVFTTNVISAETCLMKQKITTSCQKEELCCKVFEHDLDVVPTLLA